jgi:superfamily II DNA/RNA helicase
MITLLGRGRARARMPRSLVLCPTRELAAQVAENFDNYARHHRLSKALLIGGVSFKDQDTLIDRGVDVLIATPGRLLDHFERGKLLLTGVQILVVDEADRMLDMGFIPDIERIFNLTPFTRQTLFFSATMAPEIERITNTFLHSPARIEVARAATTGENIAQAIVPFRASKRENEASEKRALLRALIDAEGEACTNAIIFCNRKTDVDIVAKSLKKYGYNAEPIHGDLEQSQRMRTLDGFRDGRVRFLVASDVAARGLDIPAVSHVFNFDVPSHAEDYVHRIGRTGRAGRSGKAFTLCVPKDEKNLDAIERLVQTTIPRAEAPAIDAHPAPAGDAAPDRPRDRSRGRSGDGRRDRRDDRTDERTGDRPARAEGRRPDQRIGTPSAAALPAPQAETPAEPLAEPRAETLAEPAPPRDRPRRDRGPRSDRGPERRPDRAEDRIIGMGEDVPTFIAMSFDQRRSL